MIDTQNLSISLKQRFCKNSNIPISLFDEPYFSNRIESFDEYYSTKSEYDLFVNSLNRYDNEQEFYEDYNRVKDEAIEFIKNSMGYKIFNNEDMSQFSVLKKYKEIRSKDIYHRDNIGRMFFSIDMKTANFTALSYYDCSIFDYYATWTDFLKKFTNNPHFLTSKYMRQVILGNCNPARHITYEKHLMSHTLNAIEQDLPLKDIVYFSNDEIVLDVTNCTRTYILELEDAIAEIESRFDLKFTTELFQLNEIPKDDKSNFGYLKCVYGGNYKIKCADAEFLPIIIKKLDHKEIDETDYYFRFKGELARFATIPKSLEKWDGGTFYLN